MADDRSLRSPTGPLAGRVDELPEVVETRLVPVGGVHGHLRDVHAHRYEGRGRACSGGDLGEQARVVVGAPVRIVLDAVGCAVVEHLLWGVAVDRHALLDLVADDRRNPDPLGQGVGKSRLARAGGAADDGDHRVLRESGHAGL
ncbi:hypothetical protein [Nocardia sp. NPDC057227]|uniref:hypothetical protein n=1 Tax=Nocardia sp. NPDC057227 TaxID=3346056 RepID=UPI00362F515E